MDKNKLLENASSQDITVVTTCDHSALDEHKDAWNSLAQTTAPYFPTCSHAYISAFLSHSLQGNESWKVYFAYLNEKLVGVLPLILVTSTKLGIPFNTLKTPSNDDTFGVAPLLAMGHETQAFKQLLNAAWETNHYIRHIELCDISPKLSITHYSDSCFYLNTSSRIGRYINTSGELADFQSSLSKNFRRNHKKSFNKLNKLPEIHYEFITAEAGDTAYFEEFMRVEALSWKGEAGTAIKCSKEMTAFYQSLTSNLAEMGWLEWQILKTENKTIAINMAIKFHRNVIILKLGYDEAYSNCSPGGMLYQEIINKYFNDEAVDEIDIITNAKWYDDWKMSNREYASIHYYKKWDIFSIVLSYIPDKLKLIIKNNKVLFNFAKKLLKRK